MVEPEEEDDQGKGQEHEPQDVKMVCPPPESVEGGRRESRDGDAVGENMEVGEKREVLATEGAEAKTA